MIWNISYPKNLQGNKIWGSGGIPQLLPKKYSLTHSVHSVPFWVFLFSRYNMLKHFLLLELFGKLVQFSSFSKQTWPWGNAYPRSSNFKSA